jgi:hypothetical protein
LAAKTPDSNRDFLSIAATRLSFDGAKIQARRLIPDDDHVLEPGRDEKTITLRMRDGGGGPGVTISCDCAVEGGSCVPVIMNPGGPDEYGVCSPDSGCGSSGLLCFMDFSLSAGTRLRVKM